MQQTSETESNVCEVLQVYNTAADVTMDPAPATDGTPAKKKKKS